jgi:hypothetical protein
MRNTLLAILVAMLPASIAVAQQTGAAKPENPIRAAKPLRIKRADPGNSCAAYGPGFVKVDGSETCVKIGGGIDIGVGSSTTHR